MVGKANKMRLRMRKSSKEWRERRSGEGEKKFMEEGSKKMNEINELTGRDTTELRLLIGRCSPDGNTDE